MRKEFLPFSPPSIDKQEIDEVVEALKSGWITTGPRTKLFEQEFSAFVGAPAAMALSSCTAALHTALVLAEIGPGDEVITTPMTFAATVAVIEHVGATPVLVDVEPDTLNIDPRLVAAAITERTRAVIPVHYGGHPCDLDPLLELCRQHDLWLIEDAAHSLPALYRDRMIGADAGYARNLVAFSFYATKNLTTAEGGMLVGPEVLMERAQVVSLHGMDKDAWKRNTAEGSWRYDIVMPGFKYNMTDLQAAMGLVQLKKLNTFDEKRRQVVARYNEAFGKLDGCRVPVERSDCRSAWHLYPLSLMIDEIPMSRDAFIQQLREDGIGTSVHFIPVHSFTYYREKYGHRDGDFPVAWDHFLRTVSLPLHPGLTSDDQDRVIAAVQSALGRS